MLNSSQTHNSRLRSRFALLLTPFTIGVAWGLSGAIPVSANPVILQSPSCSSVIYGSPIPAPVPVNPVTGQPCSLSSSSDYRSNNDYGYETRIRTPIRGTIIRDSTLINPTIIDSTISDSVLVDPVIINSPRSTRRVLLRSEVISPSSGIRIYVDR